MAARGALPAPAQIRDIQVSSYNLAAELNNPAPHNTLAAKFSVPFAVATRLVHGHSGLASFSWDAVRNPAVLALAQRVSVTRSGRANLNNFLSGNSGHKVRPRTAGQTGVFDGQEVSTTHTSYAHARF